MVLSFGVSYLAGAKFHSGRVTKKMKSKHLKDQKALYTQYYSDVYKLEEQKAEQQAVIEQLQAALAWWTTLQTWLGSLLRAVLLRI